MSAKQELISEAVAAVSVALAAYARAQRYAFNVLEIAETAEAKHARHLAYDIETKLTELNSYLRCAQRAQRLEERASNQ